MEHNTGTPSVCKRKRVEIQPDIQEWCWDEYFKIAGDFHSNHFRNTGKNRILVLSGTKVYDCKENTKGRICTALSFEVLKDKFSFIDDCDQIKLIRQNLKTNFMVFKLIDISLYFPEASNMSKENHNIAVKLLLKDIKDFWPTMIILPFSPITFSSYPVPMDYRDIGFKYDRLDLINVLLRHKILQELIIRNKNCMFFKTRNIYQTEKCILTSATPTSGSGLETSIPGLLDHLIALGNPYETRVLVVSGSHGDQYNKMSGFTYSK